ncbi:unnamed protein product [Porites evermanni]|uniref:Uncharacterized protein n=1 Tax=Porites evermanni TaxID=104178 RepID=A0ABN8R9R4_9CNID|nr:unnamed protein product [Porites evermanni]
MAKQVELSIRCVVKGYNECPFEANIGENVYAFKKRGERGNEEVLRMIQKGDGDAVEGKMMLARHSQLETHKNKAGWLPSNIQLLCKEEFMFPRDKGQEEATNGGSSLKNFKKPPVPSETVVANIVASDVREAMAIDTGNRLAKVITSHCIPTLHSTDLLPVEIIVLSKRDSEAKAELAVAAKVRKVLLSTASSAVNSKDAIIQEIEHQMQQSKTPRVPEIALKLACIIENPTEDNRYLTSIVSNFIQNNGVVSGKRWNDDVKDLFAIILDYGGPALVKIVSERLNGPSVMTSFRRARSTWTTPITLKEVSVERTAAFCESIGYRGPFSLAVDATAVIPTLRIKGNTVYGLATESDVIATSAQDVIDIVKNSNIEKAKQANAFTLVPL